ACDAGGCDAGGCDAGRTSEPGGGDAIETGGAACACPVGGGREGGAYDTGPCDNGRVVCSDGADGCGYGASSWILWVGASLCSTGVKRAPHPPQNRESGSFSVPHVGQRIPPSA